MKKTIEYPGRAICIQIEVDECEFGFKQKVISALRRLADAIEKDEEGADDACGCIELPADDYCSATRIKWEAAQVVLNEPTTYKPDEHDPMPPADVLADLTPAERQALEVFEVYMTPNGWKASNGQHDVFVSSDAETFGEAQAVMIDTLRKAEIIGPDDTPTFHFGGNNEH